MNSIVLPVMAGLTIGILLIIIFASVFDSTSNATISTTPNNLKLAIEGLKESYRTGQPITFTLRVTGYGDCYQTPNAAIWKASSTFASEPVWGSGLPSFTCFSKLQFTHFVNDTYEWKEDSSAAINDAGDYVLGARIGVNPAVQKEFVVIGR